ncbi:right-handed parallel beta-helix repeat-containing protein [Nocardioides jejuensis]|uniref:right-handed parallel beta-helix repeat-containing protein n=1 Tax=Nocardioides jejuensis TaxID=2502782 RepID=UPI001A9EEF0F|nr:right-handed parallel beta-helix repeat-containing protein [Nocardioides jejuensis]
MTALVGACAQQPRQTISVADFGSRGDGVHDDTDAFRRALDAARLAGNTTVRVPASPAGYVVRHLTIPSGVTLAGDRSRPALLASGQTPLWIALSGSGVVLSDLTLRTRGVVSAAGVRIGQGSDGVSLRNVSLEAPGDRPPLALVDVGGSTRNVTLDGCTLVGGSNGFRLIGAADGITLTANHFAGWRDRAIWFAGTHDGAPRSVRVDNNTVRPHAPGGRVRQPIQFTGFDSRPTVDVAVTNNRVTGPGTDYLDPLRPGSADLISLHHCSDFRVTGNLAQGGGEVGITVAQQCSDGVIEDNTCVSNGSCGIAVGSATSRWVRNVQVLDNRVVGNGVRGRGDRTPDWARAGIVVEKATGVTLSGNRSGNPATGTPQLYGITIRDADPRLERNVLTGNLLAEVQR